VPPGTFSVEPDEYFRQGQPYVDGMDGLVIPDESTALTMYRTGQLDLGPQINWAVRQQDLKAMKQSHPHLIYQDFLGVLPGVVFMRVDMAPFSDVHVLGRMSRIMAPTIASTTGVVPPRGGWTDKGWQSWDGEGLSAVASAQEAPW
jgi:ABC-type transport system substrate-binding protein